MKRLIVIFIPFLFSETYEVSAQNRDYVDSEVIVWVEKGSTAAHRIAQGYSTPEIKIDQPKVERIK